MRLLVLGATGLLGNAVFRVLSEREDWEVFGTSRSQADDGLFVGRLASRLTPVVDLESMDELTAVFDRVRPTVVVNCVGGRRLGALTLERALSIYSILPRRVSHLCRLFGARLVHISSDGVFSGSRGAYTEDDWPDATDVYGVAKMLGEVLEPHAVTLRTSMIGHELRMSSGLLEWFLASSGSCRCFGRAIFSGLPSVEIARVIRDFIVPRPELSGLYHLAADPISKFDLLTLVKERYGTSVEIIRDDSVVIDRSLSSARFKSATGYSAAPWAVLVQNMHSYRFGLAG